MGERLPSRSVSRSASGFTEKQAECRMRFAPGGNNLSAYGNPNLASHILSMVGKSV